MKYIHTLSIGGEDHHLKVTMLNSKQFLENWYNLILKHTDILNEIIEDNTKVNTPAYLIYLKDFESFSYNCIYTCLIGKKSFFIKDKKPFKNVNDMVNKVLDEESEDIFNFIINKILKTATPDLSNSKKKQTIKQ